MDFWVCLLEILFILSALRVFFSSCWIYSNYIYSFISTFIYYRNAPTERSPVQCNAATDRSHEFAAMHNDPALLYSDAGMIDVLCIKMANHKYFCLVGV